MYEIYTANTKTEKRLLDYIQQIPSIKRKLENLKISPRSTAGAHPLHGKLKGKWSCWLGSNIRILYTINDKEEIIIIEAISSHKIY